MKLGGGYAMGIIIPNEAELKSEGLFFGQIIIPKKDHVTRWDIGQITRFSRLDLSVGPVLNIVDLITGHKYQELPSYIDFLIRVEVSVDIKMLHIHQLVTPYLYGKEEFPGWLVGRICGLVDGVGDVFKEYFIMDVQSNKIHQVSIDDMEILTRKKSSFFLEM